MPSTSAGATGYGDGFLRRLRTSVAAPTSGRGIVRAGGVAPDARTGTLIAIFCNPQFEGASERMMMGVKVFTATKAREREMLGEAVTRWLAENPRAQVTDKIVTQSSDSAFHCLSITLFYEEK